MSHFFRRLIFTLPVIFGVATLSFLLLHFVPGDPVDIMLGDQAATVDKAALRAKLGLDLPLSRQYLIYLKKLTHLDLGHSLLGGRSVQAELAERIPATFELTFAAMAIAICFGIPLGVIGAIYSGTWAERLIASASLFGISVPSFWLAPMLVWIFSLRLDLFPVSERGGFQHLVLPAVSLSFGLIAILIQITRISMLDVLQADYMRTARAKGVAPSVLYFKHALKNAAMPLVTTLGLQFGALLTGTVIIETIFDWPGVGTLLYQAIQQRNYPLVQGCVLFMAITYVIVTLLTDAAYTFANPQVGLE